MLFLTLPANSVHPGIAVIFRVISGVFAGLKTFKNFSGLFEGLWGASHLTPVG